ncbi:PPE family protein [Mycobacterium xenopi 3993]|nr:PPE family protein [Mycobacterium xenopi 3993]
MSAPMPNVPGHFSPWSTQCSRSFPTEVSVCRHAVHHFAPEITSALIHSGPGAHSLVEAATAWRQLGAKLEESAESYAAAVSSLTGTWHGPSATAMAQAVEPYLTWLRTTAQQCQRIASSTQTAAAAFDSARVAMVSVAQVAANRMRLAQLLATNGFGRNLPAIAETEDQYQDMWVNNSAAMSRYQATSAHATALPGFASPPSVSNPSGLAAKPAWRPPLPVLRRRRRWRRWRASIRKAAGLDWRTPMPTNSSRPDFPSTCSAIWRRTRRLRRCRQWAARSARAFRRVRLLWAH